MTQIGRGSAKRILNSRRFTVCVTLTVERAGERNDFGEYEAGTPQTYDIRASQEPVDNAETLRRIMGEEADRVKDARYFFIEVCGDEDFIRPLRTGVAQTRNDTITYNDIKYCIRQVADYTEHGHVEVIAVRMEGQND